MKRCGGHCLLGQTEWVKGDIISLETPSPLLGGSVMSSVHTKTLIMCNTRSNSKNHLKSLISFKQTYLTPSPKQNKYTSPT